MERSLELGKSVEHLVQESLLEAARQVTGRRAAYRKTVVLPATRITPPTGSVARLPTGAAKTTSAAPAATGTPRPPGAGPTSIFLRMSRTAAAIYPKMSNLERGPTPLL